MNQTLKKRREFMNLTQKEVAEQIKIDESAYRQYEISNRQPSAKRAIAIANVLNSTVEKLFGVSSEEK